MSEHLLSVYNIYLFPDVGHIKCTVSNALQADRLLLRYTGRFTVVVFMQIKSIMEGNALPAPLSNTNWGGSAVNDSTAAEDQDSGW